MIYLDKDFRCHVGDDGGGEYLLWDDVNDFFRGKSRAFIEGYRVVPDGETWISPDGTEFIGLMISPAENYSTLEPAQKIYEELNPKIEDVDLVASIPFVIMAQSEQIDDVTITEHAGIFTEWSEYGKYIVKDIRRYQDKLYRCVQSHTGQASWSPDKTPALWTSIGDPTEEWPQWSQPIGGHDAYDKDAKVSHKDKHWISTISGNVWEPGVHGWNKIE